LILSQLVRRLRKLMAEQVVTPKTIKIFISSPGDVVEEREMVVRVIENLRSRYEGKLFLKAVRWEDMPLQADTSFMEGIDPVLVSKEGIDIAVFILWSRMGALQDGGKHRSGTERELDFMLAAREKSDDQRPAILVYVRSDDDAFAERLRGKKVDEQRELIDQKAQLEQFIEETFQDSATGRNVRAFHSFDQPVTFAGRLQNHLIELLDDMADCPLTAPPPPVVGKELSHSHSTPNPAKSRTLLVIAALVLVGLVVGGIYIFSRDSIALDTTNELNKKLTLDRDFPVAIAVNAPINGDAYRLGEKLTFKITMPEEGHLLLVSRSENQPGEVLLFPSAFRQDASVKKNETLTFPDPDSGTEYELTYPPGKEIVYARAFTSYPAFERALGGENLVELQTLRRGDGPQFVEMSGDRRAIRIVDKNARTGFGFVEFESKE
jgi:hypothetical protein